MPVPVIVGLDSVYFPTFPYPKDGIVLPLDANNKLVLDDNSEIVSVIMPYWYWNLIIDYATKIETAAAALQAAAERPP